MKVYLLMKHTIKENYKYLLTLLLSYGFIAVLYHISDNYEIQHYVIQTVAYALTLGNAVILPNILFKNYYHQTNTNHVASIPMKRLEIFSSLYFVGIGLSVAMILGYSCMTTLLENNLTIFVDYSSVLLVSFAYYYHLSLLAFWICGHIFFQGVVIAVMIFGPFIAYMVYHWALSTYDSTYYMVVNIETIARLLPGVGCAYYWFDMDATHLFGLYLILAIIYLVFTVIVVRYRPYERTGQSIMFRSLSYIVRSVTVLLGLAALFAIFGIVLGTYDYLAQFVSCIILGVMVAYVVEMIYKKKTRVFHSIKYGVLAAIVVFGSVHLGTKALEGYIPNNYDQISLQIDTYYPHSFDGSIIIKDEELCESIVGLNEQLMSEYVDDYDYFGDVIIEYCNEDGEPFFGRNYNFTKEMFEDVVNNKEYHDLFIETITTRDREILEIVEKRIPITFFGYSHYKEEDMKYTLDTEAEFYLFENYLRQEIDAFYALENIEFNDESENLYYFDYEYLGENNEIYQNWTESEFIYNALAKTFDFDYIR